MQLRVSFRGNALISQSISHLTMVSKAFTYFRHVGVLKTFQNGIFNSSTGTFLKNVINASMSLCVSTSALSSKQFKRTSSATCAIAVNNDTSNKIIYARGMIDLSVKHIKIYPIETHTPRTTYVIR